MQLGKLKRTRYDLHSYRHQCHFSCRYGGHHRKRALVRQCFTAIFTVPSIFRLKYYRRLQHLHRMPCTGRHDAPEDAAIIYTMMGCCKEVGADFRKWTNYLSPTVSDKLQQFLQTSTSISENLQGFRRILREICNTGFAECLRFLRKFFDAKNR